MGTDNRNRRQAARRKEREHRRHRSAAQTGSATGPQTGSQPGSRTGPPPSGQYRPGDAEQVLALVGQAVQAFHHGRPGPAQRVVGLLADGPAGWRTTVDRILFAELQQAVAQVWPRGWQPAELVRGARRETGTVGSDLTADLVVAQYRSYAAARVAPEWAEQVRALGEPWWGRDADHPQRFAERHRLRRPAAVDTALRVLTFLYAVPALQVLCPLPGHARTVSAGAATRADPAKLARIRALLAKAEATEFPEEAEALSARAQEMMARHSIDHAALAAQAGTTGDTRGRRLPVEAPYEQHKASLLSVVSEANHCRSVWHKDLGMCTVMGAAGDVDAVELLFTSLLLQATRAMRQAGATRDAYGRSTTRSFRTSFLTAFTARIGERLAEAAVTGRDRAVDEYAESGTDLVPVLARREREVEEAFAEAFPELVEVPVASSSNAEGWTAGRAAADAADFGVRDRLGG
ncbi:DUF2786 domain-containing protein [Nocardiopsis sp. NPDC006198]|uniref:DUF2786 domain-containing protein n=1 Tax=Nocardiopsis sp. NPDC006198 TaxID=3154472 RepID=UPI0033B7FC50